MDKKLNEVTKVTDMAYVPVIMADGSIGQIAKADLASVVAGMMCKILNSGTDLNTVKDNGMYFIGINSINSPVSYFYFIVLKTIHNADLIQFGFSLLDEHLYKRTYNNGVWSEWITFG